MGGQGDDLLSGGAGDDTYVFNIGDGTDHLVDAAGQNTISFGEGISPDSLSLDLGSLLIRYGVGVDPVHIDLFNPQDVFASPSIVHFNFADGSKLDFATLLGRGFDLHGMAGNDTITGTGINDRISAEGGNDAIYAMAGDDVLDGGAGDDLLVGGAGNDRYVFGFDSGSDRIDEAGALAADEDVIDLKARPDEITVDRAGGDVVIRLTGTSDSLTLKNFDAVGNRIESLMFSDGAVWNRSRLIAEAPPLNRPPTLEIDVADQSTLEDAAISLTLPSGEFADVDIGDTLTIDATCTDGSALPAWLTFDATTRTFAGTPTNADVGTVSLKVTATDVAGATAFDVFNLSIINTNDAPTLTIDVDDQSAIEDAAFCFTLPAGEFGDVDAGDVLTLGAARADGSALPSWLTFDAATRTFAGTPSNADVGTVALMVIAADGAGAKASDSFNLAVINTNDAPIAANDGFALLENATTVNLSAAVLANDSDPDIGDSRRISAVNTTGTLGTVNFDPISQSLVYAANGSAFDVLRAGATATDTFGYIVSDAAGATAMAAVTMTIAGVNDAPVLNLQTANQSTTAGTPFSVTLAANTFADIDAGDTLSYGVQLADGAPLPSWLRFDAVTRTFSGTAASADVGSLALRVIATDSGNLTATEAFTLTVGPAIGQTLIGTAGNDVLIGSAGNDTLDGRAGSDRLLGNDGDDTFKYSTDGTWGSGYVAYNAGSPGIAGTGLTAAIVGKNRSFDVFEGGSGVDVILGTAGDDAIFLDDSFSAFPNGPVARFAGVERIEGGAGNDVIDLTSNIYAYGNVTLDGGDGNDVLWASSGNDVLLGGAGNDDLFGGAGQDYLEGGTGNDTLNGGRGNDLMQGSSGNDTLTDGFGNNLFYARDGNDSLKGGDGNELFIGGSGNDSIVTGTGTDIIAFNRGDGHDAIARSTPQDNTVSLGGGIRFSDLYLSKQGNNLVLQTAANEDITFTDWYSGTTNRGVLNLQMIVEGSADYAPAGVDALRDNKVERFDFSVIAQKFDQARAGSASNGNHWAVMNALLDAHLGNGSDSEVLGGDLAYRYGMTGTLAGISIDSAQSVLASSQFGIASQVLHANSGLQEGLLKLG